MTEPAPEPVAKPPAELSTSAGNQTPGGVRYLEIGADHQGQRIDNFLLAHLKGAPRSLVYRIIRSGEVRVNRGRVKPATRLEAGDSLRLPPLRLTPAAPAVTPTAGLQARLLDAVLYEDEGLILIDKPSGLAVHGGSGLSLGLIEALRAMRPQQSLELVHRLDRETSGCLLISKKPAILRWLHQQLREGQVRKRYQALLVGGLPRERVDVRAPLRKNLLRGGERVVRVDHAEGKEARTGFRRAETLAGFTLVDVRLGTGRTHQIRVHAAHLGAAVAGDDKYGDATHNQHLSSLGLNRLFLHAAELGFRPHPEAEPLVVRAPLPEDLHQVLERLRRKAPD
ncbi:RluA family pseudouridine synthase [Thiorhodovibrio frisius]|uniref:Pseudouridine synthase n=1 Tax=Thiorhodovibrio frisius TaxID=631362 RepID=H8YXD9_9GAMM|nr:RluA family pseudouridine synthase [Thiorhodovibrio frisius]EIC23115.1 pseudouridine synthase, RluA family [Thiorhodovibrio frisius]WPL22621.1 Ribosomal large subunit pseudouridine synthase C [Thiorhodovibrio frisius]